MQWWCPPPFSTFLASPPCSFLNIFIPSAPFAPLKKRNCSFELIVQSNKRQKIKPKTINLHQKSDNSVKYQKNRKKFFENLKIYKKILAHRKNLKIFSEKNWKRTSQRNKKKTDTLKMKLRWLVLFIEVSIFIWYSFMGRLYGFQLLIYMTHMKISRNF